LFHENRHSYTETTQLDVHLVDPCNLSMVSVAMLGFRSGRGRRKGEENQPRIKKVRKVKTLTLTVRW
jgi:hypothetical protein